MTPSNAPAGLALRAKLYLQGEPSHGDIAWTAVSGGYAARFHLDEPSLVGTIPVWVDEPFQRREMVTD